MWSSHDAFENDLCPVRDDLLGQMYRASESGLPQLVDNVSPDVRAMLALFCYRRSHLHALAIAIAGSCTERDLVHFGGRVGSVLYDLSRSAKASSGRVPLAPGGRKPVTLATKPIAPLVPLDVDDIDDIEDEQPAEAVMV